MMKRSSVLKWTISCSLLLLSTLVWCQTFNKIYPASDARMSLGRSIDLDSTSDSLVLHSITINGAKSLIRHKISPDGETSTFRTKEFGDTSLAPGIAESYRMESSASMCAYGSSYEAILERFNDNFESVYRINHAHTDTSYCLYQLSLKSIDGSTIAAKGCILQYDTIIGDDAVPMVLEKRDEGGDLIWESIFFDDAFAFHTSSLIEMPNGDLLVSGLDRGSWQTDPTILHYSSTGEFIDQDIFVPNPNNNLWDQGCHCTLFTDTTVVCAYTQALYHALNDPYNLPDWTIRKLHLMEYNPFTNEVIWDHMYDNLIGHNHYVNDIERTNEGEIIVVGSLYHSPIIYELCDSLYSFTFSYLSKFDISGNQEWQRRYTHDMDALSYIGSEHILYDVEEMTDGGFAAVGDCSENNLTITTSPWVIRTDEWGCVEPGCQNIAVSEFAVDNFATVFPNPSTGALNIHTSHSAQLQLFNSNGQLIHEQALPHSGQHQITMNNPLPAGVYVVHLSNEQSAQTLKWVVVDE
jgi:Secretion system C-terminal sorting domain